MLVCGNCSVALFDASKVQATDEAIIALRRGKALTRVSSPNLLTTGGLNAISLALNWALIQTAQTNNWTTMPFSSSQGNLGDCYGAVGGSTATVMATDTVLGSESGRSIVSVATTASGPKITLNALLTASQANGAITEVGWFAGASTVSGSGTLLDHAVLASSVTKTSSNTALITWQLTLSSA